MAGEGLMDIEIIYCVPWQYHSVAAWMVNEFVDVGGNAVSVEVRPGVSGVLQVYVDGDKIYDKAEEGNETPHLNRVKELKAIVKDRLESARAAAAAD